MADAVREAGAANWAWWIMMKMVGQGSSGAGDLWSGGLARVTLSRPREFEIRILHNLAPYINAPPASPSHTRTHAPQLHRVTIPNEAHDTARNHSHGSLVFLLLAKDSTARAGGRGRGGKFNKVKRGGGKKFSRDLQPLNADGEVVGMWGEQPGKVDEESSEEESSEEESSDDEDKPEQAEMTREQRRDAAKARKQAAIAKKNKKVAEPGDLPTDSEEEESDDDMPANPNHTAKARSQAAKAPEAAEAAEPAAAPAKGKGKQQDLSQLSRREREAVQAQQAKERYEKLHAEGKTEQARSDLERLALVKERREAEAARKKAEAEERAELEKEKAELMEREKRRREQAMGKKERLAKGGKKKA
ncbi:hypothetical protein HBI47_112790 [Parastagonospora nodorum]|nr:hypothetical protein HBI47_112790 [Parastagonospora nodorum]